MLQKGRVSRTAEVNRRMRPGDEISRLEERILVLLAQRGDMEAFGRLVTLYERRLLYYILRFLEDADQALDVLQEVWLSAFRLLPRLEAPEAFRVWIYKITHGKVVEFLRLKRRMATSAEGAASSAPDVAASSEPALENVELVHHALAHLSVEHRGVLVLHFLEGMRLEEIAQSLSCPLGTVKSRMHHAKRLLREVIERLSHDGR
jgi:RNA polymerase sigma-70 factor (ECF subfamily)